MVGNIITNEPGDPIKRAAEAPDVTGSPLGSSILDWVPLGLGSFAFADEVGGCFRERCGDEANQTP